MTDFTAKLQKLQAQIRDCEARHGRAPGSVIFLPVSKGQPLEKIERIRRLGVDRFGENYLREAEGKMARTSGCVWHFIGPVQSNKTRGIAARFDWVQSVERVKIAARLDSQRPAELPRLNVCVQVNISGESGKSGVAPDEAGALCGTVAKLPRLRLRGLMAIPAKLPTEREQRRQFRALAGHFNRLRETFPEMDTLSMGMSGDFEAAIAEGATLVRIGQALFGKRTP